MKKVLSLLVMVTVMMIHNVSSAAFWGIWNGTTYTNANGKNYKGKAGIDICAQENLADTATVPCTAGSCSNWCNNTAPNTACRTGGGLNDDCISWCAEQGDTNCS